MSEPTNEPADILAMLESMLSVGGHPLAHQVIQSARDEIVELREIVARQNGGEPLGQILIDQEHTNTMASLAAHKRALQLLKLIVGGTATNRGTSTLGEFIKAVLREDWTAAEVHAPRPPFGDIEPERGTP